MSAFAVGQVAGALLVGALGGALVNLSSVLSFAIAMGIGGLASALVCRFWPGYDAPAWQLWLVGVMANPLFLVAVGFSIDASDCVLGGRQGRACLFADIGPLVIGACLLPPLIGLGWRALRRAPPTPRRPP